MASRLYGRGRIITFVTDALDRDGVPERQTLPVLLLAGQHGSGGTALWRRLGEEFGPDTLGAHLDLATAQGVGDAVLATAHCLRRKIRWVRRVEFPRLRILIKALSYVDLSGDPRDFGAYLSAESPAARSTLPDWLGRALDLVGADSAAAKEETGPDQERDEDKRDKARAAQAAQTIAWALSGISHRDDQTALAWFADNEIADHPAESEDGPAASAGYPALWRLLRLHHRGDQAHSREIDLTLCAALLADLSESFNSRAFGHVQRRSNCLLALDNADTETGGRLLRLLGEWRRVRTDPEGDPLLVVAVRRARVPELAAAEIDATDERLAFPWPSAAKDPCLRIRLTDLAAGEVVELTRSRVLGSSGHDARLVHDLAHGHPLATATLIAVLAQPDTTRADLPWLLDKNLPAALEPAPTDRFGGPRRSVADHLFTRIFADEIRAEGLEQDSNPLIAAMAVCAATPGLPIGPSQMVIESVAEHYRQPEQAADPADRTEAQGGPALGQEAASDSVDWTQVRGDEALSRLEAAGWATPSPDGDGSLLLHPLPDRLLRDWLADRSDTWRLVHEGYAAHYARPDDVALHQRHLLALAESTQAEQFTAVAAFLDSRLNNRAANAPGLAEPQWLALLKTVATAPNRLYPEVNPRAFVAQVDDARLEPRGRVIARLTAALWVNADRRLDPGHRLAQVIAEEYKTLAHLQMPDGEAFFEEAYEWRRIAKEWEE
ncbi:MAG TPA: hypothetical protein VGX23_16425 [Actinocrinis sp.]|nr:hypothetical protein [Actinocrinis sp.]